MNENGTEISITTRQRLALEALALGKSVADAARAANVARQTMYRWLAQPDFSAELRRLDADGLRRLGRAVMGLSDKATQALEAALDPAERITTRLRAASVVLERGPALAELTALVERVELLEQAVRHERA